MRLLRTLSGAFILILLIKVQETENCGRRLNFFGNALTTLSLDKFDILSSVIFLFYEMRSFFVYLIILREHFPRCAVLCICCKISVAYLRKLSPLSFYLYGQYLSSISSNPSLLLLQTNYQTFFIESWTLFSTSLHHYKESHYEVKLKYTIGYYIRYNIYN